MKEFMNFDKLIAPIFIKVLFLIGVLLAVLVGFIMIGIGVSYGVDGLGEMILGILFIVIGPFIVRIHCELIMVAFKVFRILGKINQKLD